MSRILALLALPALAFATPALADTATHREVWLPAGKTVKLYRPIRQERCATATRHHPAGKLAHHAAAPADPACDTLAAREAARPTRQSGE